MADVDGITAAAIAELRAAAGDGPAIAEAIARIWAAGAERGRDWYAVRRLGYSERAADLRAVRAAVWRAMRGEP